MSEWGHVAESVAVTAILTDSKGRYLMILRDDIPGIYAPRHWSFCGGQVESEESFRHAVCREVEEELGIDLWYSEDFLPFYVIQEPTKPSVVFECGPLSENVEITLTEGQRWAWIAPEQIIDGRYDGHPVVRPHLELIQRACPRC